MIATVNKAASALAAIGGPAVLARELAHVRAEAQRGCHRQLSAIERVVDTSNRPRPAVPSAKRKEASP